MATGCDPMKRLAMRALLRTAIIVLVGLKSTFPVSAEEPEVGSREWMRDRTFDAIAISRLAERLCPKLAVDETLENLMLSYYNLKTWADLPRDRVERFMAGFARDRGGACDYAWTMYGYGSGGSHNPGMRLLRRVVRNPF